MEICYWVRRMLGQQLKEVCLVPHISMANPLTASRGGRAWDCSGLSLPIVMAYNSEEQSVRSVYANLARIIKLVDSDTSDHDASKKLIGRVKELLMLAEFSKSLSELGFTHSEIPNSCHRMHPSNGQLHSTPGRWMHQFLKNFIPNF